MVIYTNPLQEAETGELQIPGQPGQLSETIKEKKGTGRHSWHVGGPVHKGKQTAEHRGKQTVFEYKQNSIKALVVSRCLA